MKGNACKGKLWTCIILVLKEHLVLAVYGQLFLNVGMTCLFQGHTVKVSADMSFTLELKMGF